MPFHSEARKLLTDIGLFGIEIFFQLCDGTFAFHQLAQNHQPRGI